jgi:hypothetical protein
MCDPYDETRVLKWKMLTKQYRSWYMIVRVLDL